MASPPPGLDPTLFYGALPPPPPSSGPPNSGKPAVPPRPPGVGLPPAVIAANSKSPRNAALPPPPPPPGLGGANRDSSSSAGASPAELKERRRSLSNQGIALLNQATSPAQSTKPTIKEASGKEDALARLINQPAGPVPSANAAGKEDAIRKATRHTSSDDDEETGGMASLVLNPCPMVEIEPVHNPIDISLVVPPAADTFAQQPFIVMHVWRDEDAQPVSRRSSRLTMAADSAAAASTAARAAGSMAPPRNSMAANPAANRRRSTKLSEKRLSSTIETVHEAERRATLAKEGRGSDWSLFNKDYTVVLRASRVAAIKWNQLHHRTKHADVSLFVGARSEDPVAVLKGASTAARLLFLERTSDGGDVYTLSKHKINGARVFFIQEGRVAAVDPHTCGFALIVSSSRVIVKARGTASPPRHLSSRNLMMDVQSLPGFTQTVVDFREDAGWGMRIASGFDLVLAFACVVLSDRFMNYSSMQPDEALRKSLVRLCALFRCVCADRCAVGGPL